MDNVANMDLASTESTPVQDGNKEKGATSKVVSVKANSSLIVKHKEQNKIRVLKFLDALTPRQKTLIDNVMNKEEETTVAQVNDKKCSLKSFKTLQPKKWLTDEVINFYFDLLGDRNKKMSRKCPQQKPDLFFNSFFYTKLNNIGLTDKKKKNKFEYNNVKNWSTRNFSHVSDIFEARKLFIPVNRGKNHWACIVVSMTKKRIQYYDSLMSFPKTYLENIKRYLLYEHIAKKNEPLPNSEDWMLEDCTGKTPKQNNTSDCGVFACMVARFITNECPLIFDQRCINRCRERIALDILWYTESNKASLEAPSEPRVVANVLTKTVTNIHKVEDIIMSDNLTSNDPVDSIDVKLNLPILDNNNNEKTENAYITIFPNFASNKELKPTEISILNSKMFRQYVVGSQLEPRIHFLLHEKATNNFGEKQPSYKYKNVCLKAKPLHLMPEVANIAKRLAEYCKVPYWNIGVDVLLYRNETDHISFHSDNDQGEQVVATLVISNNTSDKERVVRFQPNKEQQDNDNKVVDLYMQAGDVYITNKAVQDNYVHKLTRSTTVSHINISSNQHIEEGQRMAIVFRFGKEVFRESDSGIAVDTIIKRKPVFHIGDIDGLVVGDVFTKTELYRKDYHNAYEKGVSGSRNKGCNAIVARFEKNHAGEFVEPSHIRYGAVMSHGGYALEKSMNSGIPVRVFFLSSKSTTDTTPPKFQYDGLYMVTNMKSIEAHKRDVYLFDLKKPIP